MPLSHSIRAHLLVFTLDRQRYALRLDRVQRVVRAAAVTPLPKAPEIVLGVLDLQGQVVPVINLRRRFSLPEREIRSDDQLVVARAGALTVALAVDGTESVLEEGELELTSPEEIVAGTSFLEGVAATRQGLLLIHDLEALLFPAEESQLSKALEERAG
ncbi:chemotaxis protein CheW [Geomonas sp.]|uniref:chemotaxis protein CheW n=1 Tax=Geomonas sp. TaxID=2651584 RepID=UPI002B46B382|nr:chemotaxis protein CheW [Geomonas sp.]HJV33944.1 chemotaxis protein CheW [Geomonas sp.]